MSKKREMKHEDFAVEVEGVGNFIFSYRTMRDEFRIQTEYSRLTEGIAYPAPSLHEYATIFATLKVLTVEAPDGWDLSEMDPLDKEVFDNVVKVFNALRDQEEFFRKSPAEGSKEQGAGNGENDGVLDKKEVQHTSD